MSYLEEAFFKTVKCIKIFWFFFVVVVVIYFEFGSIVVEDTVYIDFHH